MYIPEFLILIPKNCNHLDIVFVTDNYKNCSSRSWSLDKFSGVMKQTVSTYSHPYFIKGSLSTLWVFNFQSWKFSGKNYWSLLRIKSPSSLLVMNKMECTNVSFDTIRRMILLLFPSLILSSWKWNDSKSEIKTTPLKIKGDR